MKKIGKIKIQKNAMISIIAILVVLFGAAVGIVVYRMYGTNSAENTNKANVAWYSESEDEFTITTAQELYDLAALSDFYDFAEQTILLGADIVVNEGNAEDWVDESPEKVWFPIQGFAGTFDGQGHTISGLYGVGISTPMGLFSDTSSDCVIRDLKLLNSYFYVDGSQGVGSITSNGSGIFEKIYSDAIVSTNHYYAGGLIGKIDSGKGSAVLSSSSRLTDCWFDGEVNLTSDKCRMGGGLIGAVVHGTVRMSHCLSTAEINCPEDLIAWITGGFCGSVGVSEEADKNGVLNVEDCLGLASIQTNYNTSVGSYIGNIAKNGTVTYKDSYVQKGELKVCDVAAGVQNGAVLQMKSKQLIGEEAFRWTSLDFNMHWSAIEDKTPELRCFTDERAVNLEDIEKAYNLDWYDEEASVFVIDTVEELYGLQMLCNQKITFAETTVKLGADIVINEGKATDWAKGLNLPELEWEPIGGAENYYRPFSGTFDGQGHTISGLYLKSDGQYLGLFGVLDSSGCSKIQNLKLTNSYLESTRTEPLQSQVEGLGSIAGQGAGTLDTVYSDAIVVSTTSNTGGLVGNQRQPKSTLSITNCWFNGNVTGVRFVGGLVGYVSGYVGSTFMTDCLVTANLTSTLKTDRSYVGGLSGRITSGVVSSCLVVGELNGSEVVNGLIGLNVVTNGALSITKCYNATNIEDMYRLGAGHTLSLMVRKVSVEEIRGTNGYVNTLLGFYDANKNKEGRWVAVKNKTPQLKSFTNEGTLSVKNLARAVMEVDISWYDASKKSYSIKNAAQLYGFAELCNCGTDFEGKTVKLSADIKVNDGNATDWAKGINIPNNKWTPIGTDTGWAFDGTFDGQGHTISGIYMSSDGKYLGLFGVLDPKGKSVIKNLKLTNSYMERTNAEAFTTQVEGLGSIAGQGCGTLDTIYSDAIIVNHGVNTGGLIGNHRQPKQTLTVTNCWFDGSVTSGTGNVTRSDGKTASDWVGGLIGYVHSDTKEIKVADCLVTADLTSKYSGGKAYCGGIAARYALGSIDSCVVTGEMSVENGQICSMVGMNVKNTLSIKQCYNASNATQHYFNIKPAQVDAKNVSEQELTGTEAYANTLLKFYDQNTNASGRWVIAKNAIVQLRSFAKAEYMTDLSELTDIIRPIVADVSWYKANQKTFTIKTAEEFYGFAQLVNKGNTFAGKIVKLGADIKVNSGFATDWAEGKNIPSNKWTPIGTDTGWAFAGTFDGQGHAISGVYLSSDGKYLGLFGVLDPKGNSIVKNLELTNSYMERTNAEAFTSQVEGLGSIAGQGCGVLDTIYSDAIIVNHGVNTGGLIGNHRQPKQTLTVTNCWFDGSVTGAAGNVTRSDGKTASDWVGGLIGFVHSDTGEIKVTDCYVTADLTSKYTAGKAYCGGISGRFANGNIESSVVAGTMSVENGYICSMVGMNVKNTLSIENCYNASDANLHYYNVDPALVDVRNVSESQLTGAEAYANTLLQFYDKNANEAGRWAIADTVPVQLRSFATAEYIADLSGFADIVRPIVADISWYDADKDVYTIDTAEEFYGFATLVNGGNKFAGKTVKLGADIKVNNGTAIDWSQGKNIPNNKWTPIGTDTGWAFAGTFDGQGHTISGVYLSSDGKYLGLFGVLDPNEKAVIKNLKLTNSYMERTNAEAFTSQVEGLGSIAGQACGLLDTVYSDAIIVNHGVNTGGLVGNHRQPNKTLTITNSWFDGSATSATGNVTRSDGQIASDWVGGLVGYVHGDVKETKVSDCLVTADLTSKYNVGKTYCGGIAARIGAGYVKSCVVQGTMTIQNGNLRSIVGMNVKNTLSIEKCYNATNATAHYYNIVPSRVDVKNVSKDDLKGTKAFTNTWLEFYMKDVNEDGKWVAIKEDMPTLKNFASPEKIEDVSSMERTIVADTSWYDANKSEFTIYTANELYGFAKLCNEGKTFANKKVQLGSDIKVNYGKATDWANGEKIPANKWTPIGNSTENSFLGVFDGKGYEISGLYVNTTADGAGLFGYAANGGVSNLYLVNSFINTTKSAVGSIVGRGEGTFTNIYSDAIIHSTSTHIGGIIGNVRDDVTSSTAQKDNTVLAITNCWFDGVIESTTNVKNTYAGGMVGFQTFGKGTIHDCLFTGTINYIYSGNENSDSRIGGIVGAFNAKPNVEPMEISNTLSAGIIHVVNNSTYSVKQVGPVVGKYQNSLVLKSAYASLALNSAISTFDTDASKVAESFVDLTSTDSIDACLTALNTTESVWEARTIRNRKLLVPKNFKHF